MSDPNQIVGTKTGAAVGGKIVQPKASQAGKKLVSGVEVVYKDGVVLYVYPTRIDALERALEIGGKVKYIEFGRDVAAELKEK